jgi:hypothetical protein
LNSSSCASTRRQNPVAGPGRGCPWERALPAPGGREASGTHHPPPPSSLLRRATARRLDAPRAAVPAARELAPVAARPAAEAAAPVEGRGVGFVPPMRRAARAAASAERYRAVPRAAVSSAARGPRSGRGPRRGDWWQTSPGHRAQTRWGAPCGRSGLELWMGERPVSGRALRRCHIGRRSGGCALECDRTRVQLQDVLVSQLGHERAGGALLSM